MKLAAGLGAIAAALPLLTASAAPSAPRLSDTQIRAFVAQQERAWNTGALDAYFASFTPDAVFTDQYRTPGGQIVPYGSTPLAQARTHARRFRAAARVSERGEILGIRISPDGATAQVISREVSRTEGAKGVRTSCAERRQDLLLAQGRLRSKGQTDTFSRCPAH